VQAAILSEVNMHLSRIEVAALRAAEAAPLRRFRVPFSASVAYGFGAGDPTRVTPRTVLKLARFGFLRMDDSTEARLTEFGREALRSLATPRPRGRPRARSAA
jgi:hypothetical protein